MKNIIILDVYDNFISSALASSEVNIVMALVDAQYIADKCKERYGDKIKNYYYRVPMTNEEFDEMTASDYNLTYDDIEKFRATQVKCEHYLHREISDVGVMQYRYFMALRFWLGFFEKNKIDFIFSGQIEHGAPWDSIPIDIAKSKGIPVYSMSITSGDAANREINCVTRLNDNTFLDLSDLELTKIDFDDYMDGLAKSMVNFQKPKDTLSSKIKRFKVQFNRFIHFLKFIKKSTYKKFIIRAGRYVFWDNLPKEEMFRKSFYVNKLKKIYNRISVLPQKNEKYIYFPLHQEPEASIMARAILGSQLFIAKTISEALPEGWKLYIKEHPAQMYAYNVATYFYRNIEFFRSGDFYNEIRKLKNVRIIDVDYPQYPLIENAQAIASIAGTALIQGVLKNKPIIPFGKALSCTELLKDSFNISSFSEVKNAVNKITSGFKPDYSDFNQVIDKYAFMTRCYERVQHKEHDNDMITVFKKLAKLK